MTHILYGRVSTTPSLLAEAVESCKAILQGADTYALLYAFDRCHLARLNEEDQLCGIHYDEQRQPYEAPVDLSHVFEARVFSKRAELRWLHKSKRRGKAVLLAEERIPAFLTQDLPEIVPLETLPQRYLLWG